MDAQRQRAVGWSAWLDLFLTSVNKCIELLFNLLQFRALEIHILAKKKNQCVRQWLDLQGSKVAKRRYRERRALAINVFVGAVVASLTL